MIKQKAVIFDIDGVLAKKSPDRDFREYDKVDLDLPIEITFFLCEQCIMNDYEIFWITGRKELCRDKTIDFIYNNLPKSNSYIAHKLLSKYSDKYQEGVLKESISMSLFMRADKCHQKSDELKRNIYNKHIKDKYDVVAVFEDDPKNVKMFRELGLMVYDVGQDNK